MAENKQSDSAKAPAIGFRHLQTFLLSLAIGVSFAGKNNLSLAIVGMTDKNSNHFVEFSTKEKSLILSSFAWGYVITQLPGGYCARKFGGRITILFGLLINSIAALVTPPIAFVGDWRLIAAVRTIQGMGQGLVHPSTHTILAKWAPKEERSLLSMLTYCGGQLGTVIMFASSGFIASSRLGWPGIFYISGGVSVVWVILWSIWGSSSPDDHKSISAAEKAYIQKTMPNVEEDATSTKRRPKTPWLKFFQSAPFLALLVTHCSFNYLSWTFLSQIPTYLNKIFKFDIKSNALLTSLPYLAMFVLDFVFAGLDSLIRKCNCVRLTTRRKIFNTFGLWIPAVALVCLSFLDKSHPKLAVSLLVIAVGFGGAIFMGFMVNHIDLSPNFAGILMAITNMTANMIGITAPLVVGVVVTDEESTFQWRIVFFIAAGFVFLGNLLFLICGSARVQSFNEPNNIKNEEVKNKDTDKGTSK